MEQNLEWCCWEAPVVTQVFLSKTTQGEKKRQQQNPASIVEPNSHVMFLFIGRFKQDATSHFSWAPRLLSLHNNSDFCCFSFFLNFLLDRVEHKFVNGHSSNTADACGSPQGCVLSPLLFMTLTSPLGSVRSRLCPTSVCSVVGGR